MLIVPNIGDRVEHTVAGVSKRGRVHYADELQALVKWDDGSSSSLRLDREKLRIVQPPPKQTRRPETPEPHVHEREQVIASRAATAAP